MDKKINVQQQLERGVPIFLIAESPGDVAKHFNNVAGFDQIDKVILLGKTSINDSKNELDNKKITLKSKKKELTQYSYIKSFDKLVKQAEQEELKELKLTEKIENIESIINQINEFIPVLKQKQKKLEIKNFIKKAEIQYNKLTDYEDKLNKVILLRNAIVNKEKRNEIIQKELNILPLIDRAFAFNNIIKEYDIKIKAIEQIIYRINLSSNKLKGLRANYKETLIKYKKLMPETCPICGGKIK